MKKITLIFLLSLCFSSARSQSFEIEHMPVDTINKIDRAGYKQGKWIIKGRHQQYFKGGYGFPKSMYEGFTAEQTIEKGMYKNNRKEGEWTEYYKNGKMRNKLTYVNGTLDGPAVFYDQTEKVMKEGKFKANKWVQ